MLTLPDPPRFHLTQAPLAQALVQINYPLVARLDSLAGLAPVQEQLSDAYPYMQQQQVSEINVLVGPGGAAPATTSSSTVTTFNDDEGWQVAVGVGSTTLSVGAAYAGVEDFAQRLRDLCKVLGETAGLRRADRLGVRYLDVVPIDPSGSDGWTTWFRPEIVGLVRPDLLGDATLLATVTETRLTRAPRDARPGWSSSSVQALIRHGVLPANSVLPGVPPQQPLPTPSFVLDFDLFVVGSQVFQADTVAEQYRALHREIERVFYWTLTEQGARRFGLLLEEGAAAPELRGGA